MYQIVITNRFRKDVKLLQKRGYDMELLKKLIVQYIGIMRLTKDQIHLINQPDAYT